MKRLTALQDAIAMAKTGELEGMERLFALTAGEAYYMTHSLLRAQAGATRLLVETYVELYRRLKDTSVKSETFYQFLEQIIIELVQTRWRVRLEDMPLAFLHAGIREWMPDEKLTLIWMTIEERILLLEQEEGHVSKEDGTVDYIFSGLQIAFTVALVGVFVAVLVMGWNSVKSKSVAHLPQDGNYDQGIQQISIEEELPKAGWSRKKGMLYYVRKNQTVASGDLTIGKQILTFDQDGQLIGIQDNGSVIYQAGVCFDEDIKYEIQDGDIYRKSADGKEKTCVVRNGHISYVNVHDKYLYYICEYQVPNSQRVRRVMMRCDLDGTDSKELMTGGIASDYNRLQVSGKYMFYIEGGKLLRENMEDGTIEVMANGVSLFYPKGGTVYYIKEQQLAKASSGTPYVDDKRFYRVEVDEKEILLKDQSGKLVAEDDSKNILIGDGSYQVTGGKIQEVTPGIKSFGDISYQIGEDRKLTWKGALGIGGMVRQSGRSVDGFCVADSWLYYSARVEETEDMPVKSQIYRINLEDNREEVVSEIFEGVVEEFYCVEDTREIYGEYVVSREAKSHGRIVVIPLGGTPSLLVEDDRPKGEKDGWDKLEFVMVQDGTLYSIFKGYFWDEEGQQWQIGQSEPVLLETVKREDFIH